MQKSQVACVLISVTPGGRGNGTAIARHLPAQKTFLNEDSLRRQFDMKLKSPFVWTVVMFISATAIGATFDCRSIISLQGSANDAGDGNRASSPVRPPSIAGAIDTAGNFSRVLSTDAPAITDKDTESGGKTSSAPVSVAIPSFNNPPAV